MSRPLKPSCRFLSVNSKTSKKSMADRVVSPRWTMLFFEDLQSTDKNDAASLGVSMPLVILVTRDHANHVLNYKYLTLATIKHIYDSMHA